MQAIYDYFLTKLNDNTDSLVYKGNYIFKFYTDSMEVYELITNTLVKQAVEFSPVSVMSKQQIPFVENNGRIDWAINFGILVRISGQEYDATTDLDYANITSVLSDMQGLAVTLSGKRYTFKTQEPTYNGYVVLGQSKYAILSCEIQATQITSGYFGQDSAWSIDTYDLDVVNVNRSATRSYYTKRKLNDDTNDYNKVVGRALVFELTFNYVGEALLLQELNGVTTTLYTNHVLKEVFNGTTTTWNVTIESINEIAAPGSVKKLTIRCVEIKS